MKGQENKESSEGEILVSGSCILSGLTTWDQLKVCIYFILLYHSS